jgi:hypothetical protein
MSLRRRLVVEGTHLPQAAALQGRPKQKSGLKRFRSSGYACSCQCPQVTIILTLVLQLAERVAKLANKTHKDRVSEFNAHLESLSEHHDIPKVNRPLSRHDRCCISHFIILGRPGIKSLYLFVLVCKFAQGGSGCVAIDVATSLPQVSVQKQPRNIFVEG